MATNIHLVSQDLERKQQALIDHLDESKLTIEALTGRYDRLGSRWTNLCFFIELTTFAIVYAMQCECIENAIEPRQRRRSGGARAHDEPD